MREIYLNLDSVDKKDLEQVLSQVSLGDEFALRIIEKKTRLMDAVELEEVFLKIVNKAKMVVLIAAPVFEVLLRNADPLKVKFIEDENFSPEIPHPAAVEDVLKGLVENFWVHHFPNMASAVDLSGIKFYSHAMVELEEKNIQYILIFGFDLEGLKLSVEKILQYPVVDFESDLQELSSEVLNMMCGKLRPLFKRANIDVDIGIPAFVSSDGKWVQKHHKIRSWNYKLSQGACVEIKLYKWVGYV